MHKLKKCYHCQLATSICECFNLFFYSLSEKEIEEVSCSNGKFRTIIKIAVQEEALTFLKKRLGCGGKWTKTQIEIQGKHKEKLLLEISNF